MRDEYVKLIEEHDKTLSSLTELWRGSTEPKQRERLYSAINRGLDDRLRLMKARDSQPIDIKSL